MNNTLRKLPKRQEWRIWSPYDEDDKSTEIGHVYQSCLRPNCWMVNIYNVGIWKGGLFDFNSKEKAIEFAKTAKQTRIK